MSGRLETPDGNGGIRQVRHTVGLDLGTSSLRLQIAHFDALGRPVGEPAAVHLPHSERDGVMPTVLQLSPAGELLAYGRAAVQRLPHSREVPGPDSPRFVAEFKPCIGQAKEDLAAQGRPEKARHCTNPACTRPGWAWSVALQYCGFCGAPLTEPEEAWQPQFPYGPEEALVYARLLLSEVRLHLERRLNEPLRQSSGWQVVAGVPVHWQAGTRARYQQVLAQSFPEAGITLLSEPEGALRYYGCQGLVRAVDGWTLVVDFGAGTTDLVLGRVFNRGSDQLLGEVRAYGERYGGADFDLLLARFAAAELGVELEAGLLSRWKLEAQRWKEAFSDAAQFDPVAETGFSFPVPIGEGGCDFRQVVMNRQSFSRVAGELLERFRSVLERGLRHFGAEAGAVTQVVLTGGGAQWYFVEEAVRELCPGAHVIGGVEPVRAIARGLALAPVLPQLLEAPARSPEPPELVPPLPPLPESEPLPPIPGLDLEHELKLTWSEATEGCRRNVSTGTGEATLEFAAGEVSDGEVIRLPGAGEPGRHGGRPGDLLVRVRVAPQPVVRSEPPEDLEAEERLPAPMPAAAQQATLLRTLRITQGRLMTAALSTDGSVVATGLEAGLTKWGKGSITLWDAATGMEQRTLPGEIPKGLVFSKDDSRMAVLYMTGATQTNCRVVLLDLASGTVLWSQTRSETPRALDYSSATNRIVTVNITTSETISVCFWNTTTPSENFFIASNEIFNPWSVALTPDGSATAIPYDQPGTGANSVRVYRNGGKSLATWVELPERNFSWTWALKLPCTPAAFSPDGDTLAIGSRARSASGLNGRIYLLQWRPDKGSKPPKMPYKFAELEKEGKARVLEGHKDHVQQVAFSPNGRILASGGHDGTIHLWDLESGTVRQTLTVHAASIMHLAFSRTGDRMMSASWDGIIQIWNLE